MLCVCVCVAHPGHVWLWIRLRGSNFDHGVQSSAEWHTQRGGEKRGKGGEQSRQKYLQVCGTVLALSLSLHAIPSSSFSSLFKLIHYLHLKQQIQN